VPVTVDDFDELEYMRLITPRFQVLTESIANLEIKRDDAIELAIKSRDEHIAKIVVAD
jgi:hypothetical protein